LKRKAWKINVAYKNERIKINSFHFNFHSFSGAYYGEHPGRKAYTSTRLNGFPFLEKRRSEINGGITGSRNVMVQRKDPRRSVFSRGDKTNGSVSSGGRNPDGPKSCSFVSARAKLSLDYSVCYTNDATARKISYGKKQLLDAACRTSNGNTYRADYRNKTFLERILFLSLSLCLVPVACKSFLNVFFWMRSKEN